MLLNQLSLKYDIDKWMAVWFGDQQSRTRFFMVSWYILWNSNKSWGKEYVLQINLDLPVYFWFSGSSFVHECGSRSCDPKSTPHTRSAAVNSNSAVIVGMILSPARYCMHIQCLCMNYRYNKFANFFKNKKRLQEIMK